MHDYHLLEILALGFSLALIFGYITHRLGFSPIVGYLIAGFLVGPQSPGFVADPSLATQLSEAGVILLMFGVGLHFNLDDLVAVKGVAVTGALIQIAVATLCGTLVGSYFGLSMISGLMLGLGLAVASTVVLLRVLTDNNVLDTVHGHVAVGWLVVEDIFTVLILVLLPSLAGMLQSNEAIGIIPVSYAILKALIKLILLWVIVLVIGGRVVPWLLTKVVRTRSQELFTLTILVVAFATAVGAAVIFEASMALGAFLGGMVVGKSKLSHQAGEDLLPLRDAFAVLFFLSVGMLFKPTYLLEQPWLILASLAIVLLVKSFTAALVVSFLGYSVRTGLTVATSLAQVGEFSFILAQVAQSLNLISTDVYNVLVVCALISIAINPGFFSLIPKIEGFLQKNEKLWNWLNAKADRRAMEHTEENSELLHNLDDPIVAIVIGYGPVGASAVDTFKKHSITPVVIDLNVDTVNELHDLDEYAIFGNSTKKSVLEAAGIDKAAYLVITLPVIADVVSTIATALSLNPDVRIFVRARFLNDEPLLKQVGIKGIAFEEEEVAKAITNLINEDIATKPLEE